MKRHLQCAEQQVSPSNLTKYCTCHEKWLGCCIVLTYETSFPRRGATGVTIQPPQILHLPRKMTLQDVKENLQKQVKRHFQCGADPTMIRPWSENDPSMKTQTATRLATEVTFRAHHEHFLLKNTTFRAQSYIQTFTTYCACHEKWHLNFTKYCTCHEKWHLNFTKYCTCHEKWLDCCIVLTYETSFPMRGATGVTIQPPRILHLPRKMTLQDVKENLQKQVKRHFQCGADPTMIRPWSENDPSMKTQTATRLATEVTFRGHHEHFLLKNTTFRAQSYIQTFTKYCACHEKWHLNFTKYCACHEKWHLNFTKYCTCHEKWHFNFTK